MVINKYRIFCLTEQVYKYVWGEEPPTACPTNTAHEVSIESISVVERMDNDVILTQPDNAFQMQADAVCTEITKGTTGTIDFKIQNYGDESFDTKYLSGAEIYTDNAVLGDWAESQIIDIDNVLGYGANLVLKTYVRKMFLFPGVRQSVKATAPGAIPVGLYIRVIYHSVGAEANPTIYVNYDIEIKG